MVKSKEYQVYKKQEEIMKRIVTVIVMLVLCIAVVSVNAQSKNFAVKLSGHDFQSADMVFGTGNFRPYVGLDYLSLGMDITLESEYMGDATLEMGAGLFIPHAGCRFLLSSANPTKPYIFAGIFKSFASVKMEIEDEDILGEDAEDMIKDLLGFWGLQLGFGAEYTVTDWFAVGGEFGFKMYRTGTELEMTGDLLDLDLEEAITADLTASLKNTYAAFVLNFYF